MALTAAAVLTLLLLRTAWAAEDAYISFRVVDNFLHGFGLRWNVSDRVQTFTDPLFLGLVTVGTAISGNVFLSVIALSLILTLAAYLILARGATEIGLVTATVALIFSKAFIDFSVSGLENPATHFLLAAYLYVYWRNRNPFWLTLLAALAASNRLDTVLFLLPSLVAVYVRVGRRSWKPALLGATPLLAWSLFALFYYGFLLPNPACAFLHAGIPVRDFLFQGIVYYLNAFQYDTATVFVIMLGCIIAWLTREWLLAVGIALNLLYILVTGGDLLSARLFSAPLFVSAALIARYWRPSPLFAALTIAAIAALGLWIPAPTVTSAVDDVKPKWSEPGGPIDARAVTYPSTGLLHYARGTHWPVSVHTEAGEAARDSRTKVAVNSAVGLFGFSAGPQVHVIDDLGGCDALLARLPRIPGPWTVDRYQRALPAGYENTIRTGVNTIQDPRLHDYYEHLHTVISGNLWSWNRLVEIFRFNTGQYGALLGAARQAH